MDLSDKINHDVSFVPVIFRTYPYHSTVVFLVWSFFILYGLCDL